MREIDLSGPEGNAYNLLGLAKKWASQLDLDYKQIQAEMTESDYEHLCETFEKYFGEFAILIYPEEY